jgi:beta-lactamase class C
MARWNVVGAAVAGLCIMAPATGRAAGDDIETAVQQTIRPVMERYGIPGMAVGIVTRQQSRVYDYGIASKATGRPVTGDTLFEIGSISKTFTATLVSVAQVDGDLALSDMASKYLPSLRGSSFDKVSLLHLGTHTAGGFPLQVPDDITNGEQLMAYFLNWTPGHAPGTYRTYSNVSSGMLGMIAANSMHQDFTGLMEGKLFPALGLEHTYLEIPATQMENYAQGYSAKDVPIRMTHGVLWAETYGVRTTAGDMLRFVEANLRMLDLDEKPQRAVTLTHTGYYRIGTMTQDLIWEEYRYPIALDKLLPGHSGKVRGTAKPAIALDPPLQPRDDVLIDKTGSTNGFGAYVAFVPGRKLGIVLLANKDYPIDARVTAAYKILTRLDNH